tara:strand:- start:195 stop:488 length:294 start_codon:yes stop_codon:yes gene_type:complete
MIDVNNFEELKDNKSETSNDLFILKFDKSSQSREPFNYILDIVKIINITDEEIIKFYEIDILPTILIFKNKIVVEKIFDKNILSNKDNLVQLILKYI